MLRDVHVGNLHHFAVQSSPDDRLHSAEAQPWKDLGRRLAQNFFGALPGEPLHVRIEDPVSQLQIVGHDAFSGVLNDGAIEFHRVAQRDFTGTLRGYVARNSKDPLRIAVAVLDGADNDVPPARLTSKPGFEVPGEASNFSASRSF